MLVNPWIGKSGQAAFYRQITQADEGYTAEVELMLGSIDEPTHIVWGTEDTWIPSERAHRLHDLVPGSTLRLIAHAGHLIQLDAPAELTAELVRWTESVRASE
jgi:pimeloyl-ACP methyl ester carboxylesterase